MSFDSISISLLQTLMSDSDIHSILEHIAQHVDQNVQGGARGIIFLYDPVRNCLIPGSRPHFPFLLQDPYRENIFPISPDGPPAFRAICFKKTILCKNAELDAGWDLFRERAQALNIKANYAIPILSTHNEPLGVLTIYYGKFLTCEPNEVKFFQALASLAGVAIEKHQDQIQKAQTLAELQNSKERLNLALESQKMGIWDWFMGPPNQLLWDENMFQVFGIEPKDFDGTFQSFANCVHPEDLGVVDNILNDVFTKDFPYDTQFRILRKGEVRHIAAIGKLTRDPQGNPIRMTGLNWDVTDKVLAARKLEQERARAILSSKMASLGEMASGIAHEINNPLTIILNLSSRLKDRILTDQCEKSQAVEELTRIEKTVERIAKIIRGLRSISRNSDKDPLSPCELNSILDECLALCRERFQSHGILLKVKEQPHSVPIQCRPSQISQVLLNILNNAFDAVLGTENSWIEIEFLVIQKRILLRITDSGKGISDAIADKIMDPFFTTKEVGKGTGLGLSISKSIVEDHGGKLYLDREHPQTSFVVELPAADKTSLSSACRKS